MIFISFFTLFIQHITNIIYKLKQLKVTAKYGLKEKFTQTSHVVACSKCGMDDTLFWNYIKNIIVLSYPNISNEYIIKMGRLLKVQLPLK